MCKSVFVLLPCVLAAERVTLENPSARMAWEMDGGALVEFKLKELDLNPLVWEDRSSSAARPRSHFLCLDRWGAPSEAEAAAGVPFHGEAARVSWKLLGSNATDAEMTAQLPLARLAVKRTVRLQGGVALVREAVTNLAPLGRIYNMVQHPTIGPPFLDQATVVDANARQGFMQSSPLPNPENPMVVWPQALKDGVPVNLRELKDDPNPNVVSFVIDDETGWAAAVNAAKGLMIGYAWKTADYPWFNAWRHVEGGQPVARGLEFGTTGLHQPYAVLVKKGRIFGRPLYSYLDATDTAVRSYQVFLLRVPRSYRGVARITRKGGELVVGGRDGSELRVRDLLGE